MFNSIKCKYWTYISYSVLYICTKLLTYCRLYIRTNFWNTIEKKAVSVKTLNISKYPNLIFFSWDNMWQWQVSGFLFIYYWGIVFLLFMPCRICYIWICKKNNKSLSFFQNTLLWSECFEKVLRFNRSETKLFCHQHKSILSIASILVDPSKT